MKIPLVDLKAQYESIQDEIDLAIRAVLDQTAFVGGSFVKNFEASFAQYCEAKGAVGCGNGTDALILALHACGVGPGDEVILPSHTFFATPEAVVAVGAKPVFADINSDTYTLDPGSAAAHVSSRTKAIIPVHLYGHPCEMDTLMALAREHGLRVIEDCAQAHGARFKGQTVGTFGDAGCFSFYPGKNLGAYGDAGAVISNDDEILANVAKMRDHGRTSKYEHDSFGYNSRLDGLQASILSCKLRHMEDWSQARRDAAAHYDELFANSDEIITPTVSEHALPVYHLYVVRVADRDRVLKELHQQKIGAGVHYPLPCHQQPPFLTTNGTPLQSLPVTEAIAGEILSLPLFPELTEDQVERVADTLMVLSAQPLSTI